MKPIGKETLTHFKRLKDHPSKKFLDAMKALNALSDKEKIKALRAIYKGM
jgi:hypothetical protein